MNAHTPIHRSEAPRPTRAQRIADRRERSSLARRELAESDGQLALDLEARCGGVSGGAAPAAKMPEAPPHFTPEAGR